MGLRDSGTSNCNTSLGEVNDNWVLVPFGEAVVLNTFIIADTVLTSHSIVSIVRLQLVLVSSWVHPSIVIYFGKVTLGVALRCWESVW